MFGKTTQLRRLVNHVNQGNLVALFPYRDFFTALVAIFVTETILMTLIFTLIDLPPFYEVILDGAFLILVVYPILYFRFVKPLLEQYRAAIEARQATETLWLAGMDLSQTLELEKVFQILLDHIANLAPHDSSSLYLLEEPTHLVVKATRGYERMGKDGMAPSLSFNPDDNPVIAQILAQQKSAIIADIALEPNWTLRSRMVHIHSWMGIPLVVGGRVIGLLGLGKRDPSFYTHDHAQLAEALVSRAAVAIQNAWLFDQVRSGRERLLALTRQLVDVQENERRYISRELHDEVGQALVSLSLNLRLLEQRACDPNAVRELVAEIDKSLNGVSELLHELSVNLRPASLDHLGFQATARQFLEGIKEKYGLAYHYDSDDLPDDLPDMIETTLYRVLQEAVSNILKHAKATNVDVILKKRDDVLIMIIEDNGIGFDEVEARSSKRLGLFGMRERAEILGGEMIVESSSGNGTTILLEIPYGPADFDRR